MTSLLDQHDALIFDLDGTLYRGGTPLAGALEALAEAARAGRRIGYLTNNGARSAVQVAEHLGSLGFPARPSEVVTSGQAAARVLADRLRPGAEVLVVGTDALASEVIEVDLRVTECAEDAAAVVQGHSPDTGWAQLAEACLAIRAGALWVACNVDPTLPTERGELPGNGSMVAALRAATGARPVVAGKPEPLLFTEAVRRTGARRALVIGDRLGTDIAGANTSGLPSLLVLTGVSNAVALLAAAEPDRPSYVGADLSVLHADARLAEPVARPPWRVRTEDTELVLTATGDAGGEPDPVAALRALCEVHWARGGGPTRVGAEGETAAAALRALGLEQRTEHAEQRPVD